MAHEVGYALVLVVFIVMLVSRWRLSEPRRRLVSGALARAAFVFSAVFIIIGASLAIRYIDDGHATADVPARTANNVYLILLDGYPRGDTLAQDLGIDNTEFLSGLNQHGFDVYSSYRSAREYSELTLLALFEGDMSDTPLQSKSAADRRLVRSQLNNAALPTAILEEGFEFVVIDSPIGHVTFTTGRHIQHGGFNNFEERLLADSLLGRLVPALAPYAVTSSLRDHFESGLESLVALAEPDAGRVVFGHFLVPHLPILYDADGNATPVPDYWPRRQLFGSTIEDLDITFESYVEGFAGHLATVNDKVSVTIDRLIARDPDAAIVVFSDHGARYSLNAPDEWSRALFASRTPGNPELFGENPTTARVLCTLFRVYLPLQCA